MKKRYIAAGLAAAALCTGVFAAAQAGYIAIGRTLSPGEVDAMVQQSVQTAVQDIETRHLTEQQEKDRQIEALVRQIESLRAEAEQEDAAAVPAEKPQGNVPQTSVEPVSEAKAPAETEDQPAAQQPSPEPEVQPVLTAPAPEPEAVIPIQQVSHDAPAQDVPSVISFEVEYAGGGTVSFPAQDAGGKAPEPAEKAAEDGFDYTLEEFAEEVFYWTNQIREEYGLPAFERDKTLDEMAQIRATEGTHLTHTRPDGSTPDTIFAEYGSALTCTGENIAGAGGSPRSVAYGFLETSHRRCVLDPDAKYMGVGCRWTDTVIGDRIATLQLFAK